MPLKIKKILILACILTFAMPLYAQNSTDKTIDNKPVAEEELSNPPAKQIESDTPEAKDKKTTKSFFDFIAKKAYAAKIDKKQENKKLRKKWKNFLGVDIFYPYFKAKQMEHWIRDKTSIKVFKMRGRPKFEKNRFQYNFKVKF